MSPLERRYRRLLKVYPRDHRREYEEEMIGVLLADTAPGRRGPGFRAVADLVFSALAVRWARQTSGLRDERWGQALVADNMRAPEPALLGPVQWAALLTIPLLALWVAVTLNHRYEAGRAGVS